MAFFKLPPMLGEIRGKFGDCVFRQRNGKTFIARCPRPSRRPPSLAQLATRQRFELGLRYAHAALSNPATAEIYRRLGSARGKPAFSIAMADYLRPPEIVLLDLAGYTGLVGDAIVIAVTDPGEVSYVHVALKDMTGRILESGPASYRGGCWVYRTTTRPAAGFPLTIEVTAKDLPGNIALKTAPWIPPGYATPVKSTVRT